MFARYGGLQLVPSSLVGAARLAFETQGISGAAISDTGEIDPQALVALAFDTVTIRTAVTPDIVINMKAPSTPGQQSIINQLHPQIFLSGRFGTVPLQPWGQETTPEGEWSTRIKVGIGIAAGVLGLAVLGKALL
jgi:hypothetical protein